MRLIFAIVLCATQVFAEDSCEYGGRVWSYVVNEDGSIRITGANPSDGIWEVPASLDGRSVSTVSGYSKDISGLIVPEGVEHIWGFEGCGNLRTVILPESISDISGLAFRGCSIERFVAPSNHVRVGAWAFERCTNFRDIEVGTWFFDCLNQEDISGYKNGQCLRNQCITNCVVKGSAGECFIKRETFSGCTFLESVEFRGSSVVLSNGVFKDCSALHSINWVAD